MTDLKMGISTLFGVGSQNNQEPRICVPTGGEMVALITLGRGGILLLKMTH